ncbi:major facilitator superfamily domain-containing protein [Hypoxylon sp. NC1633]|nr:major facilitator superfamily domain-containing protein [Hypoxylon sp. NC1633]
MPSQHLGMVKQDSPVMADSKVEDHFAAVRENGSSDTLDETLAAVGVDMKAAHKDKALALLSHNHVNFDPNSPEARRVLRKIDMRIMPMVFAVYLFMLIDKNSLSYAALMNIKTDTHLSADQYSWLGSIVYFGYLAGDVPAMYLMQNLPLAKVFGVSCLLWGIVEMLHSACSNFAGLATLRFFLGFFEVYTAPATIIIFGSWYTKKEQVTRLLIWYTCYGFSNVLSGFFSWAIYQAPAFRWQSLFIFYGGITSVIGIICFFWLAQSPTDASWLTEEEKLIALERVRKNKTGTEVWRVNWAQLREAFVDIRFWIIFLLDISLGLPLGGISLFGPTIIANFGFNTSQSMLLNMGSGGASVVVILVAFVVAKYTNRTIAGVGVFLLSCLGCIMMLAIPASNYGARYGGYVLAIQFANCVPFMAAMMTAGVSGTTKKFAFTAAYQLGYTVGNFLGPQTYRPSDAPNYYTAKYTMLAFLILCVVLFASWGIIHRYWNHKRDKQDAIDAQNGVVHVHIENEEFADLTDWQLKSFRYPL